MRILHNNWAALGGVENEHCTSKWSNDGNLLYYYFDFDNAYPKHIQAIQQHLLAEKQSGVKRPFELEILRKDLRKKIRRQTYLYDAQLYQIITFKIEESIFSILEREVK